MSFDIHIQELENEYKLLQSYILVANESWRDMVKERFFAENLEQLPNEYTGFISQVQNLEAAFEKAEQAINNL
jgi:hypothetical protein